MKFLSFCQKCSSVIKLSLFAATLRHIIDGVSGWWRHPRWRRAALAARATAATPVVLGAATLQCVAGRWLPDIVSPMVDAWFSSESFDRIPVPPTERVERPASISITEKRLTADPLSQS